MTKDEVTAGFATPAPPATGRGTVLGGRYVLGEWLGRGGMAEVFAARDTTLKRSVAVKVFHQGAVPDDDTRRAGEVHMLAGLSHPGLVTVFDAGRDTRNAADPFAFLVMELVEGTTLGQQLRNGALPAVQVADLGAQIASALAYVHARGIVHRDIKPANILVTDPQRSHDQRPVAKLTDFGVARWLDSARLTLHGKTFGTANYLSPEQATGAEVTPASDMYSFGLVLVECLTGVLAFPGEGIEAVVVRLHRPPPIPQEFGPQWATLLRQLTDDDPAARPDATTAAQALRGLASGAQIHDEGDDLTRLMPTVALGPISTSDGLSLGIGPIRPSPANAEPISVVEAAPTSVVEAAPISAVGTRGATPRPRSRRPFWIGLALLVLAGVAAVTVVGSNSSSGPGPAPSYPAVSGQVGTHLRNLQDAVG